VRESAGAGHPARTGSVSPSSKIDTAGRALVVVRAPC